MTALDLIDLAGGVCILAMWDVAAYRRGWFARVGKAPPVAPSPVEIDFALSDLQIGQTFRDHLERMTLRARVAGPGFAIVHEVPMTCRGLHVQCRLVLHTSQIAPPMEGPRRGE